MRLVLTAKSTKGIEEKLLKSRSKKTKKNIQKNLKNEEHCISTKKMIQPKKTTILMQIKGL
jgi:hypothetical protein